MRRLLPVVEATLRHLRINEEAMAAALTEDLLATDLADYLVGRGMPFRQAHHVVGNVVRMAAERGETLSQLPLSALKDISQVFADDVAAVFSFEHSARQRNSLGGAAPEAVRAQIAEAKARLSN